ncbi:cohesin domain-containing protein [Methanolobus sp. ZRKC3]|uniref:cohesin domain-containing protein n=1 Tax=Methanolobus sp. ZRKC3 TaxID=3125786 RepID=UPI003248D13D
MRIKQNMRICFGIAFAILIMVAGTAAADTISVDDAGTGVITTPPTVSINPPSIPPSGHFEPGDKFQVTVELDSGENNLRALQVYIDYDSTAFQLNNATYEELIDLDGLKGLTVSRSLQGTYLFSMATKFASSGPIKGTLLTLEFEVKPEATNDMYELDLNKVMLIDGNHAVIPEVIVNDTQLLVTTSSPFTTLKVISDPGPFAPGDKFQATIKVISDGYSLNDVALQLNYDPSAIMVTGITDEDFFGTGTLAAPESGDNGAGTISYEVTTNEATFALVFGELFTIDFEVKDDASNGMYNLGLGNVVLKDENNIAISNTFVINSTVELSNLSSKIPIGDIPIDEYLEEVDEEAEMEIGGISLQPGWNLISFPENLDEASINHILQDLSDNKIDMIFYDDAYSGMMLVPTEFEALKGYWIHNNMSGSAIINELYLEPKVPSCPPSLNLYPGWNAIGHTAIIELPAKYALCTIDDSCIMIKGPWISSENQYAFVGYNNKEGLLGGNQVGADIFNMDMYNGYYVFVEKECILA